MSKASPRSISRREDEQSPRPRANHRSCGRFDAGRYRNRLPASRSVIPADPWRHDRGYRDYLKLRDANDAAPDRLICHSAAMRQVVNGIRHLCRRGAPRTILLRGEAGVGKRLVARAIHFNGPRRDGSFVELNCATIPCESAEALLWGRPGVVRAAHQGTLFLRKVDMLPSAVLSRLLALVRERKQRRGLGDRQRLDVQIIASSHRDLAYMAETGLFPIDLWFLLSETTLHIPPLRQRRADCVALAELFLHDLARDDGQPAKSLSDEAKDLISRHAWPGNARQLRNVVERVVLLEDALVVEPSHLQLSRDGRIKATTSGVGMGRPNGHVPATTAVVRERWTAWAERLTSLQSRGLQSALRGHGAETEIPPKRKDSV